MTGSYNAILVVASYCVAVIASYTAIYFGTRVFHFDGAQRRNWLVAGALCLGTGIWSMHYLGMYAMQMQPAIQYDPVWVSISAAIAVGASGAALMICRKIRDVPVQYAVWVKALAALVMGAAICGMHYSGMAAAIYPMDGTMHQGNHLQGNWMGVPTAVVVSGLLLLAIYVAYSDLRARDRAGVRSPEVRLKAAYKKASTQ